MPYKDPADQAAYIKVWRAANKEKMAATDAAYSAARPEWVAQRNALRKEQHRAAADIRDHKKLAELENQLAEIFASINRRP